MEALRVLNNRYQLISIIRKGGFGIIYKGYDSVLGKDIAVKEIKPELLADKWFVEQFQKEARHVAKMNHHNIVHIFDLVQTEDGRFYIVMEYIDGVDLNTLIQECRKRGETIPPHLAVHIVAEVCKALDYAHNCIISDNNEQVNLVHQDVSPSNIMVAKSGVVKLIDFGIAGVQRRVLAEEGKISLQGKVPYMSPEHVGAETRLDRRSDLFSLGLVLYEVLEGRRFFDRETVDEIIETLRNGRLRLKEMRTTPKPLRDVLQRALERAPERRYQNANQFYIDLVTYLVSNSEATGIDAELARFVARLTGPAPQPNRLDALPESDLLFNDVLQDIGGVEPASPPQPATPDFPTPPPAADAPPRAPEYVPSLWSSSAEPQAPPQFAETTELYTEVGDEVKTVIDAVRLSTRGHKKLVQRVLAGVLGACLLFVLLDVVFQWTRFGTRVYDTLFPPTVRIASVPAGALVLLNGEPVPGKTPLRLDDVKPGNYELKLIADGFAPIVRMLHIPSKGDVRIQGEESRPRSEPYLFRFKTTIEIDSRPPDAEVYINGIRFGQNTPCSITWEVGEPFELELRKPGLASLSGFVLDTESMMESVDDHRLWEFETQKDPVVRARVRGLFGKFFTFKSNPADARVFLDGRPLGQTGALNQVFLATGPHEIRFEKKGYNSKSVSLDVNPDTPTTISATLSRPVKFVAFDATNGKSHDLEATITRVVRGGKTVIRGKRTPTTLNLLPYTYQVYFSKEGYKDTRVKVSPRDRIVTAKMEPLAAPFSVVIVDAESGAPLGNVEVRCKSLDDPAAPEILLDITDSEGTCSGNLKPGLYLFRTTKSGYDYQERTVMIQTQGLNLIEFNLDKRRKG